MSEQDPQVPAHVPAQEPPAPGTPPPPAQPAWTPQGPSGPRASFGRRLVAYLLDTLIVIAGVVIISLISEPLPDALGALLVVIAILLSVAYYPFFEGRPRGQTPGKMALGIRVIDFTTGGPIGYGRAVIRYLGRIVSAIPCYLGYLWMLWDKEKQTWYDKMSTSVVVPVQYYPVS
jgi:uncharacterized RDD family membrane protein YckC